MNLTPPTDEQRAAVEKANALVRDAYALLDWEHPTGMVQWIHVSEVQANDYNPNSVAVREMKLLHTSIKSDGYTQPVVVIRDDEIGKWIIVDGFHRYTIMRTQQDIYDTTSGYLPCVIIDRPLADRVASTVRHNRARGKHSVAGMSSLVFKMLQEGESDESIIEKVGLEAEELHRLKYVTGFAKLMENHEFAKAVMTEKQLKLKAAYKAEHPDESIPRNT